MDTSKKTLPATHLVTPELRLSFPNLFKAKQLPDSDKRKFSANFLIPPSTSLDPFVRALKAAIAEEWGDAAGVKLPIRDAARDKPGVKGYDQGWRFFTASANEDHPPSVVDAKGAPVTNPSLAYAGVWVRAYINAYAWTNKMKGKGVSFGLNAIQIVRDGERMGGGLPAKDVFSPIDGAEDLGGLDELNNLLG